ncbi:endonuclease/exonuclease/phosphatase family protein [Chondrinema litorale]|uniref:endonuclease/exonuclease/phosphatase family protein n=1 Tax=Chondrinema litorale TaxID=2994555 RepID=UPI0025431C7A|nr:endonuclease/exonuclease/phosphatase family protein [Chondrinema litorale]UZR98705.1 endonuclease/exonuclease/phosphatase family protein [Chondrinema litorale]
MAFKCLATALLLLIPQFFLSAQSTENEKIVKVLSFNILHGATTKGDFNLDVIANVIKDTDPDFVAMQEVDFQTNRAKKYDLVTELGWRTKMAPLFAGAMPFDDGEYGEGILSKYTFLQTRNVALPHQSQNEPRAVLEILTVLPSGDTVAFVGTHLDHLKDNTDRVAQVKKINEVFKENKYPTILAGDLNDVPNSQAINILEEVWTASYNKENPAPTFPSNKPDRKIDYVMFLPANKWKVISTEVIQDAIASDHCAYLVTLQLID